MGMGFWVGHRGIARWILVASLAIGAGACGSSASDEVDAASENGAEVLEDRELIDWDEMTAAFMPEVTAEDILTVESDSGTSYVYSFPVQQLADGVVVAMHTMWISEPGGLVPTVLWEFAGGPASPKEFEFTVSLPKDFAETADLIVFEPMPDAIVNPDPVLRWVVDMARDQDRAIGIATAAIPRSTPLELMDLLVKRTNAQRAHFQLTACGVNGVDRGDFWNASCVLKVMAENQDAFNVEQCASLVTDYGHSGPTWRGFTRACASILGISQPNSLAFFGCSSAASEDVQYACRVFVDDAIFNMCADEPDLEGDLCTYDMAAAVGESSVCGSIGDAAMQHDCAAHVDQDWRHCTNIVDDALYRTCCGQFNGVDDGQYRQCIASATAVDETDAVAAGDASTTSTTTTSTTTTTLPAPPIGGEIPSVSTEGFEAIYHCEETTRGVESDYRRKFRWADQLLVVPILSIGAEYEVMEEAAAGWGMGDYWGAPGLTVPSGRGPYVRPGAVVNHEHYNADGSISKTTTEVETFSELTMTPGATTTVTAHGQDWSVVPYSGSYTSTLDYDSESLGTIDAEKVLTITSWYHERSGLLLAAEYIWEGIRYDTNFGGDASDDLGLLRKESCELVDTNLDLTG